MCSAMWNRAWEIAKNKPKGYYDLKSEMKALYAANIPRRHPKTPTFTTLWNYAKTQDDDLKHLMQWAIVRAGEDNKELIQQMEDRRVNALDETEGPFAKTTYVNDAYEKFPDELEQFPPASDLIGVTVDVDADEGEDEGLPEWLRAESLSAMLGPGVPAIHRGGAGHALSAASLAAVTVVMAVFASMR